MQPPKQYFQEVRRFVRSAALFLSLSPPTREYFRLLGEIGEVEFVSMLQHETEALEMGRSATVDEDLSVEVQKSVRALERLDRLEQALEGKYMDYRVSPSLESINSSSIARAATRSFTRPSTSRRGRRRTARS